VSGGIYGLARIDHRGRVTDAAVERALAWTPDIRLNIQEFDGVIVVAPDDRGLFTVSGQGHLCDLSQPADRSRHGDTTTFGPDLAPNCPGLQSKESAPTGCATPP
jgi:hypothetical protein